jgi:acetolactate synthase-1/2/3 large subunit
VLEAPVLVSENARGAIDARHRLAFDGLALRAFRADADLVLGVGTRFMTTFGRQIDVGRAALVLLNADPADLGEPRAAELAIHADVGLGLRALAAAVGSPHRESREDEFEQVRKWLEDCLADITPQRRYLAAIRSVLPDDGVFVSEFTQVGYAASVGFPVYHPRGYIGPGYQGTLGYGFATALGAKAADPSRAVVSVTGDGGFSWTMQELSTLRRYGLGMVTVVFNDGAAAAWYHGKARPADQSLTGFLDSAREFAHGDYAAALQQGDLLPAATEHAVAARLADFTALDAVMLRRKKLRIEMENFRRELLAAAMRRNPALRVYIMGGVYDLATPFAGADFDISHLYLSERLRRNVQFSWYESGHMTFVDEKVIPVMTSDLARFHASAPEQVG